MIVRHTTCLVDPFREFCSELDPEQIRHPELFPRMLIAPASERAPGGSRAGDPEWIFPEDWFPSGPYRLTFRLDVPSGSLSAPTILMSRQFAAALMCSEKPRSLATISNHVALNNRLIETVAGRR